jgi:hypothetical protein
VSCFHLPSFRVVKFPGAWIDPSGSTVRLQSFKTLSVYHYHRPNHRHLLKSWFLFRHHRHHHRRHRRCHRHRHRRRHRPPRRLRRIPTSKEYQALGDCVTKKGILGKRPMSHYWIAVSSFSSLKLINLCPENLTWPRISHLYSATALHIFNIVKGPPPRDGLVLSLLWFVRILDHSNQGPRCNIVCNIAYNIACNIARNG